MLPAGREHIPFDFPKDPRGARDCISLRICRSSPVSNVIPHLSPDNKTILGDIALIKGCCDELQIPFEGIMNAFRVTTDEEYRILSLEHLATYQRSVGRLAHVVFESWDVAHSNPDGAAGFPLNLPESDPNSMTGLLCAACGLSP